MTASSSHELLATAPTLRVDQNQEFARTSATRRPKPSGSPAGREPLSSLVENHQFVDKRAGCTHTAFATTKTVPPYWPCRPTAGKCL
jgi:hypothetical protein